MIGLGVMVVTVTTAAVTAEKHFRDDTGVGEGAENGGR